VCCSRARRLLFAFPRNALRFAVFENVVGCFEDQSLPHVQMICGMIAGAAEPLCLVPMQNISIKMTHDANRPIALQRYPRFFPGLALIAREEGFSGLMLKGTRARLCLSGLDVLRVHVCAPLHAACAEVFVRLRRRGAAADCLNRLLG
jgi:hypothetical protein